MKIKGNENPMASFFFSFAEMTLKLMIAIIQFHLVFEL